MRKSSLSYKTLLLDLDGTLLDTAPDIALALNLLRAEHNLAPLPVAQVRPWISLGISKIVQCGFNILESDADFLRLRQRALQLYRENVCKHTNLFSGMEQVLLYLDTNQIRWGVVTNKPTLFTHALLKQLNLYQRAHCVVSGDTVTRAKPYPDPLWYACASLGCETNECLFVGDALPDIQAGNSAGIATLVALYGYLAEQDQPLTWGAQGTIENPLEILSWLTAVSE